MMVSARWAPQGLRCWRDSHHFEFVSASHPRSLTHTLGLEIPFRARSLAIWRGLGATPGARPEAFWWRRGRPTRLAAAKGKPRMILGGFARASGFFRPFSLRRRLGRVPAFALSLLCCGSHVLDARASREGRAGSAPLRGRPASFCLFVASFAGGVLPFLHIPLLSFLNCACGAS